MTDLTEQWKKGKLPEGHYYVKDGENIIAELLDGYFYNDGQPMTSFSGGVDEVLAPVPTYDEWKRILHYASKYEVEYTSCVMDYENLKEENAQLKELLKEVQSKIRYSSPLGIETFADLDDTLLAKINQVLGIR